MVVRAAAKGEASPQIEIVRAAAEGEASL